MNVVRVCWGAERGARSAFEKIALTWFMKRENCSKRFFGKKVNGVYFVFEILLVEGRKGVGNGTRDEGSGGGKG